MNLLRFLSLCTWILFLAFQTPSHAQPLEQFPTPNGAVYAIAKYGNTLYLGGEFRSLGTPTGNFAIAGSSTSNFITETSSVSGRVFTVISDGNNGWYVGGSFEGVGTATNINNLAHFTSSGVVDTNFSPNPDAPVFALLLQGSVLYVGGNFTTLGGQSRTRFGAVDATTGAATSLNLTASSFVSTFAIRSGILYVGGAFTTFGGSSRTRLAAVDLTSGLVTAWDPGANAFVEELLASTSGVYVAGSFTTLGGLARNYLSEVDASGSTTAFNPSPNSPVYALASDGTDLFVGGGFTSIGGSTRYALSSFNLTSQTLNAWDPSQGMAAGPIYALATNSGSVYAGGLVASVNSATVYNVFDINATTGAIGSFRPNIHAEVVALAVSGSGDVGIGGAFSSVGTKTDRRYFAALDTTSGAITSLDLNPNSYVRAMKVVGSTLYIAGDFTQIGGATRNRLAALDLTTGTIQSIPNLSINNGVYCLEIQGNTAYIGGTFTSVGGSTRNRIASIDLTGGTVTSWDPNADNTVYTLASSSTDVFAGGAFTNIGGAGRNYLAKLSTSSAAADGAWNPNPNGQIRGLLLDGSTLYATGPFSSIASVSRGSVAALDTSTAVASSLNPGVNNTPYALSSLGSLLYVGGQFSATTQPTSAEHRGAFAVNTTSAAISTLNPRINPSINSTYGIVNVLYASSNSIYAGGQFAGMYYKPGGNFGVIDAVLSASVAPTITGTAQDGQALTNATLGTWEGVPTITYARQWQRCDSSGSSCADQSGETGSGYTLSVSDVGSTVRINVTATDALTSATVSSTATAIVKPQNSGAPSITGSVLTGTTLTSSEGAWNGATGLTLVYTWKRCDSAGSNCTDIAGQTASTYVLTTDDVGSTIRAAVSASKNGSSATTSADSSQTAVITLALAELSAELRSVKFNKKKNKTTGSLFCSNAGTGSASNFQATLYLSKNNRKDSKDIRIKSTTIESLAPNSTSSEIKFTRAPKKGYKFIIAVCDDTATVSESNEDNNSASKAVKSSS